MTSPVKLWRNQAAVRSSIGQKGVILSFTMIRIPPSGFSAQAPYPVALIQCGSQKRVCQIVDYHGVPLKRGVSVELVVRRGVESDRDDVISYAIKARPLRSEIVCNNEIKSDKNV